MNMEYKIAIIGLGYVGLPLAVEFGKKFKVIGLDINLARVEELNSGHDATLEVEDENLQSALKQENGAGLHLSTAIRFKARKWCWFTFKHPVRRHQRL